MDKQNFENLLTDLYDAYNPSKKGDIPGLLVKYNGQEFDAIYTLLFRYNYPKSEHYIPEIGSVQNIKYLIEKYSAGERIFFNLLKKANPNQTEIIEQKVQQVQDEIKSTAAQTAGQVQTVIDDKLNAVDTYIKQRVQDLDRLVLEIQNKYLPAEDNLLEIKLNILWTEKELNIPSSVKNMSIGTRFLVFDSEKKFHGLEIKDIFEDYITIPGKCIKEITIDKI